VTNDADGYDDLEAFGSVSMDPSKVRLEDLITRTEFLELLEVGPTRLFALRKNDPDFPESVKWGGAVMWDRTEATQYAATRKARIAEQGSGYRKG